MAGQKGALRIAVDDWLENNPATQLSRDYRDTVGGRAAEVAELFGLLINEGVSAKLVAKAVPYVIMGMIYTLTGWDFVIALVRSDVGISIEASIQEYSDFWTGIFGNIEGSDVFEVIGAFFSEPLLAAIEGMNRSPGEPPERYVRRIYGVLASLTVAPGLAATALETLGAGQLETPAEMVRMLGDVLDLGILGSSIAAPMVESGVVADMRRSLRARYRPTRFSASELRDLWALGEISDAKIVQEAAELGWRDQDINLWLRLAFRNLTESDVWALYKTGRMSKDQVAERLRAMGYDPGDIPLLFQVNAQDEANDAELVTKSTARKAFREGLIGEGELAQILKALNLGDREIQLVVELEKLGRATDSRALTVGQIKNAWEENVLSDPEVAHYLGEEGFGGSEIDLLLATWKREIEPTFRKLNKGTILGAYLAGILDRSQALGKLKSVGLADEDARLELDLIEARNPAVFGRPQAAPTRQLSPGVLRDLLQSGLISAEVMTQRLVELNYSQGDAELLTAAAVQELQQGPRPLTQGLIESAYVHGVLDRTGAFDHLVELGFGPDEAALILDTVEAENPAVFYPESVQAVRQPTVGALVEAVRTEILDEQGYYARMAELGYDAQTARMYLELAVRQERKSSRTLTQAQIANAYSSGIMAWGEAMLRLTGLGYSDEDAKLVLQLEHVAIEDTDPWRLAFSGQLDPAIAYQQLLNMGYSEDEINAAISAYGG